MRGVILGLAVLLSPLGINADSVPTIPLGLPVHTPELSPGKLEREARRLPIAPPLFLIGADPLSLQWLARYRERLIELHAVGLLVQAKDWDDLQQVANVGQGLRITPAPGTTLAKQFGLRHYPVLLSAQGIEQ